MRWDEPPSTEVRRRAEAALLVLSIILAAALVAVSNWS